VLSLFG